MCYLFIELKKKRFILPRTGTKPFFNEENLNRNSTVIRAAVSVPCSLY